MKYKENILKHTVHLVKFGGVGVINTAVDFLVFGFFSSVLPLPIWMAQALGYTAGTANSFLMNRSYTYQKANENHRPQLVRFLVVNFIALMTSTLAIHIFTETLNWNAYLSKILILAITQAMNFLLYTIWVFRD